MSRRMSQRRSHGVRWFAALGATVTVLAGCSSGGSDDAVGPADGCEVPDGQTVKIEAAGIISGSYGPVYVADGLGYYEDAGFDVEFNTASSPTDALSLLAGGRLDVYLGAGSAGMLNQINSGVNVRIVAAEGMIGTDEQYQAPSGFYVRKDLYDSGEVTRAADLEGRRVGSFGPAGSAVSYYLGLLAESDGLRLDDFELVPLNPPSALQALGEGGIDASYLTAPFSARSVEQGKAVPLGDAKAIYGDEQAPVVMYGKTLLDTNPAAGCAFLAATMRGAEALQGEYWNDPEVAKAFADHLGVDTDFIAENAVYRFEPDLANDPRTINGMQRMFGELDLLQYDEPLQPDEVFATDLWQRAKDQRANAG